MSSALKSSRLWRIGPAGTESKNHARTVNLRSRPPRGRCSQPHAVSIFATLLLVLGILVGVGGHIPAQAAACQADVFFVGARGSGEAYGTTGFGGVVGGVFDALSKSMASDSRSVKPVPVNYPAGGVGSVLQGKYADSVDKGVTAALSDFKTIGRLLARPECANSQVVMAGYSQGAMILHLALLEGASSGDKDYARVVERLTGAMLIGDGYKVGSDSNITRLGAGASSGRNGIGTPKDFMPFPSSVSGKIVSICELGDAVCDPWWVTGAFGVPIHTDSYMLTEKSPSSLMKTAVNIVAIRTKSAIDRSETKIKQTSSRAPGPRPSAPATTERPGASRQTTTVRPVTSPPTTTAPALECVFTSTLVEDSCVGDAIYSVGQVVSEGTVICSDGTGTVYVLDAAGRDAMRSLGYTVSDDGLSITGAPTRSGSVVVAFTGTRPDGTTVRYRGRITIVEAPSPSDRRAAVSADGAALLGTDPGAEFEPLDIPTTTDLQGTTTAPTTQGTTTAPTTQGTTTAPMPQGTTTAPTPQATTTRATAPVSTPTMAPAPASFEGEVPLPASQPKSDLREEISDVSLPN